MSAADRIVRSGDVAAEAFEDAERRYLLRRQTPPPRPAPAAPADTALLPPLLEPAVRRRVRERGASPG
ncbi:hypothetical protein L5G28_16010 [Gordonia sp. HY285]|uniref:Uncharacterized protein n=1 Tax=Gordonia liuliyuniae TaxID=2911517 RepID=A0ABS9IXW7_9ACTN|nr:hypothetical protein [Gordonia liuliyuniae]MCF8590418.1 hypothetical protein [Gordonia liuliyuniae]MCF8611651.1 hypothetical protein [Gordonia liuliyuniae]